MLTVYATEKSEIYGHGNRLVIWFSGCTLHCRGCVNSALWDKASGKNYTVDNLFAVIAASENIVGVTYIGGEPLQQGADLIELSKKITDSGLDIVLFTGYEPEELSEEQRSIADYASVIITGRYDETQRDTGLLLRGSKNQRIVIKDEKLKHLYGVEARQVEVEITDAEDKYLGFPEDFI